MVRQFWVLDSSCVLKLRLCAGLGNAHLFTCVFVFVSQQRAALLEDLVAQVAGVHAAVGLLHLLPQRARVGVVLLLHGGDALRSRVLPLLLGLKTRKDAKLGCLFCSDRKNTFNDS